MRINKLKQIVESRDMPAKDKRFLLETIKSVTESSEELIVVIKESIRKLFLIVFANILIGLLIILFGFKLLNVFVVSLLAGVTLGIVTVCLIYLMNYFILKKKIMLYYDDVIIKYPPGFYPMKVFGFLFSAKINERVFEPIVADMQIEYFEALSDGFIKKARWVHVRGILTVIFIALSQLPISIVDVLVKIWKIS